MAQKVAERVSRYLEKAGYLVRDVEADYLDLYTEEDAMVGIVGASISYTKLHPVPASTGFSGTMSFLSPISQRLPTSVK